MHLHNTLATLEPQNYVVARTAWTENMLLLSGRLVEYQHF